MQAHHKEVDHFKTSVVVSSNRQILFKMHRDSSTIVDKYYKNN